MPNYTFLDGYPYLPITAIEGFQIRDCMIHHLKDGQSISSWDFNTPGQAAFPAAWLRQFWKDLNAAPQFTIREDQWSSNYYSILGDHLVAWTDDRKEGTNFVERSVPLAECLGHWSVSEKAREWIRQNLPKG